MVPCLDCNGIKIAAIAKRIYYILINIYVLIHD